MSPTKKAKLSRVINKYNKTRKKLKEKLIQEEIELKKLKRIYGKNYKTYKDFTLRMNLPGHLTANILTMKKDMEKYEKQVKKQLEKSNKEKEKLEKLLLKLRTQMAESEDLLLSYSSPNPTALILTSQGRLQLVQLTQDRLDLEIQEEQKLRRQYKTKEDTAIEALEKLNTKISALAKKLKSLA